MALEMKAMQMELAGVIRELHMKRREVEEAEAKVAVPSEQAEGPQEEKQTMQGG